MEEKKKHADRKFPLKTWASIYTDAIVYLNGEISPRHWRLIAPTVQEKSVQNSAGSCGAKKHNMADEK